MSDDATKTVFQSLRKNVYSIFSKKYKKVILFPRDTISTPSLADHTRPLLSIWNPVSDLRPGTLSGFLIPLQGIKVGCISVLGN